MYLIVEIERPHKVKIQFVKLYKEVKEYLVTVDKKMSLPDSKFKDFHILLNKTNKLTDIYISLLDKKEIEQLKT